jgi:SAM-dependent methyltransferase
MQRSALATRLERSRITGALLMDRVSDALGRSRSREIPDNPSAHPPGSTRVETREHAAAVYLKGSGIEIGALNLPLRVPARAHVRYVDYLPAKALAEHWRERIGAEDPMVIPDVVDDGERLEKFRDRSLDFVIANHFIEHTQDPLGTLASHLRVLRPGGVVFMAVPDKRKTFDVLRPVTPLEHLVRDHTEGPQVSREAHYVEWAALVERVPSDEVHPQASRLMDEGLSIHFHTWTPDSYLRMLLHCQDTGMPIEIELVQQNEVEFLTVLRKTGAQSA